MFGQQIRRMRRRTRQALRVREWPWRRKVALGAWVPVAVVGFFLFTGPNGASSASSPPTTRPETVTTVKAPLPKLSRNQLKEAFASVNATKQEVATWVKYTRVRLTLKQQRAMEKWVAAKNRVLLGNHRAAVKSTRHTIP
jgi:hypothetical protein